MTRPRDGLYVWVTWLSKLMVGEVGCQWSPWFKTHYMGYNRAPSDFQLAVWTAEHTQLLDKLSKERYLLGESIYREDQNQFRCRRASGLIISGKPDLITIDQAGNCKVYDAKTGNPRQSDIIQVMLYMMFLPYASALYKGKELSGCVFYRSGMKSDIPFFTIDEAFQKNVTYFLNILESDNPPNRIPIPAECRFCDITSEDCPDRTDVDDADSEQGKDPEIHL